LAAIAREKAGIIKPHGCVVSAAQAPEVVVVLEQRCQEQDATLFLAGRDFAWQVEDVSVRGNRLHFEGFGQTFTHLHVPLLGRHQAANAAVALAVALQLQKQGWPIGTAPIRQGLATVEWEGRLEVLHRNPWVVFDAGHTLESAQCLRQALSDLFDYHRLWLVLGMSADKNRRAVVDCLAPLAHEVIVTRFSNLRSCDPHLLAAEVHRHQIPVHIASHPVAALEAARCTVYAWGIGILLVSGSKACYISIVFFLDIIVYWSGIGHFKAESIL
jgi:dihydrofolate synthase/folylpolyglutamate synthase